MEFKLSFNMDNAAFSDNPEHETHRLLLEVGTKILNGLTYGPVMDINGNKVGKWEIEVEPETPEPLKVYVGLYEGLLDTVEAPEGVEVYYREVLKHNEKSGKWEKVN